MPEDVYPSLDSSRLGLEATGGEEHPACWMKDGGIAYRGDVVMVTLREVTWRWMWKLGV